jgi:hypothetical protein
LSVPEDFLSLSGFVICRFGCFLRIMKWTCMAHGYEAGPLLEGPPLTNRHDPQELPASLLILLSLPPPPLLSSFHTLLFCLCPPFPRYATVLGVVCTYTSRQKKKKTEIAYQLYDDHLGRHICFCQIPQHHEQSASSHLCQWACSSSSRRVSLATRLRQHTCQG